MLSKEDWIASHRKQFPDARPDVLGFIYDFSSRSSDLYEVFVNGYCFYFANMLREAFNGGDVCWSVGRGHVVWVDDNDVAYDCRKKRTKELPCGAIECSEQARYY